MDLQQWAENLTRKVYSEYVQKYSFWEPGLKIFYSPVSYQPDLLILSYQPGGSKIDFENEDRDAFNRGDFALKHTNEYVTADYVMSRRIRSLFSFPGGLDILQKSVVLPLIFFRAPSVQFWKKNISKEVRVEMESLCFDTVLEIVRTLQPKTILVLGLDTYDQFKEISGGVEEEVILRRRKGSTTRMALKARSGNAKIIAISHPTGSRISNEDWDYCRSLVQEVVRN